MTRQIAVIVAALAVMSLGAAQAYAQETHSGPGRMEVSIAPGGGTYFMEGKNTKETSFGNYGLGAGFTVNVNRYLGFEGEFGGSLPITQDLTERRADIARAALQAERLQRPPQGVDRGLVNRKRIVGGGTAPRRRS